ncbi:MlaD family protein [Thermodesulfovibrio sp. 3907-1M]|uniref:MlaD family protein n=1 Tax=Thermodesulfovibrio autotrophicus TaxID=3118333 RepID=A0AAU8GXX4_9BACT
MFDRKKQLRWASLKVGIVITTTLLIIFFVIIFSGGIQSFFQKRVLMNIYISDVKGLRKGAPVRVAGVDVGEVKDIKLSKEYGTVVRVLIDKKVLGYLKSDARATVQTIGLLGDKYIEIFPGESQESFDISKAMHGYPQTEVREIIAVAASTMNKIEGLIQKIDFLITKVESAEGTIPKLITDPSLYNNLNSTVLELKRTVQEIRLGSIGMISRDKELSQRLANALKNFEEASNKISSQQGTLGKMINDPALYESLLNSSQRLENLLKEIEDSEGTVKMLIKDKKAAEDLKQSIKELKELIEEIKKEPKKFFKFSIF